jgi:aminopeptidase N
MHEFANKEIVARDIERVAEETYGGDMSWFFDQWIRGVGMPEYSFKYDYRRTEDRQYLVEGRIKQRVVFGKKKEELDGVFFRGVVPITVLGKDRQEYTIKVLVEGEETPFNFKLPVEPREVTLNKYGEMLAHDVLENR